MIVIPGDNVSGCIQIYLSACPLPRQGWNRNGVLHRHMAISASYWIQWEKPSSEHVRDISAVMLATNYFVDHDAAATTDHSLWTSVHVEVVLFRLDLTNTRSLLCASEAVRSFFRLSILHFILSSSLPFVLASMVLLLRGRRPGTLFKAGIHVSFNRYSQLGIKNTFRDSIRKYSRCFWRMVPSCSLDHYLGTTKSNLSPGMITRPGDAAYLLQTSGDWWSVLWKIYVRYVDAVIQHARDAKLFVGKALRW